jgi:hypothetical protein
MRLFAHFDVSGRIHSVTWLNAPQGVSLMLTPRPGELVAEVEGHNLAGSMPSEKTLRDIAKSHTIAAPLTRCTLAKKHQ